VGLASRRIRIAYQPTGQAVYVLQEKSMAERMAEASCWKQLPGKLTRARRVVAMTLFLAALNVPDLWATVAHYEAGVLLEGNPVAQHVLDEHGVVGISLYKASFVGLAIWGFLAGRRLWLAEVGCAASTCVYMGIAWLWMMYPHIPDPSNLVIKLGPNGQAVIYPGSLPDSHPLESSDEARSPSIDLCHEACCETNNAAVAH
jgi:hypothetical protein